MTNPELTQLYPHLFQEVTWPWGPVRAQFCLLQEAPPRDQIANVNIVPWVDDQWVILRLADGSWEIPGGTIEPGENYLEAIHRELQEEAGAAIISMQILGAWSCISLAEKPFRPHLPHPKFYRLVLTGEIVVSNLPSNPHGAEKVERVEMVPLQTVSDRFRSQGRFELAELYQFASTIRQGKI